MKTKAFSAIVAAALFYSSAAWSQNIASVNGKAVPQARADLLAEQIGGSGREITPEMKAQIKEEVIAREVFVQEAQKLGLESNPDFKKQLEFLQQSLLIQSLFVQYQKAHPVTDAQAQAEYDRFIAANSNSREYRARHILVDTPSAAQALIGQLKKGAKFEELARKNSKDPGTASRGGALDWASPNNYVPEFSQALVQLGKGKYTEKPVQTKFGYHIIRLDDTRKLQLPKFDDIKAQIVQQLQQQKLAQYRDELRTKAKIVVENQAP